MYKEELTKAFVSSVEIFLQEHSSLCVSNELKVVGLPGSVLEKACQEKHIPFLIEAFADRKYEDDGSLMSRKKKGSVLGLESALLQCDQMLKAKEVTTFSGKTLGFPFDTICIHGDSPDALAIAEKLSEMNAI
jgi:UPF0271 protein